MRELSSRAEGPWTCVKYRIEIVIAGVAAQCEAQTCTDRYKVCTGKSREKKSNPIPGPSASHVALFSQRVAAVPVARVAAAGVPRGAG